MNISEKNFKCWIFRDHEQQHQLTINCQLINNQVFPEEWHHCDILSVLNNTHNTWTVCYHYLVIYLTVFTKSNHLYISSLAGFVAVKKEKNTISTCPSVPCCWSKVLFIKSDFIEIPSELSLSFFYYGEDQPNNITDNSSICSLGDFLL